MQNYNSTNNVNPLTNLYKSFMILLHNITIKYTGIAEDNETLESKMNADGYLDALHKRDTFETYIDYTEYEMREVGIFLDSIIIPVLHGNIDKIPKEFRTPLLELRRNSIIKNYEEKNNYYRMLNGYPNVEDKNFLYPPEDVILNYNLRADIPIHRIQDYYNSISPGQGDYYISIIEGYGYIDDLYKNNPTKKYLKYIGSNRISIDIARNGKNFQIIQMKDTSVKDVLTDEFIRIYEQCREYFINVIYVYQYRSFFSKYDNVIAMMIMVMTLQQINAQQLSSYINRNFFDIYAVKMLYEAYNVPYNLNIDEDTQNNLLRNLNMLIQNKATDKVIYNISNLLGFSNIKVYKYFLAKERLFDIYGVPIVKWTTRFNTDTGEIEKIPDYKAMYKLYFQKFEVMDDNFLLTFDKQANHVEYNDVVKNDPFWIEDQNLERRIWENTYNFVESKYLGMGVSYKMTDIMYENIIMLKLLLQKRHDLTDVTIKLPKITGETPIPIFDIIVALLCLTACKHKLYGEIISVPTQVISVLDYVRNHEQYDYNLDTLKFNFKYFFNPSTRDKNADETNLRDQLINFMKSPKDGKLADTFQFNFDYLNPSNPDTTDRIKKIKKILSSDDYNKFVNYINIIEQDTATSTDKVKAINDIYHNIKELKTLLNFYLTKIIDKRRDYELMKTLYDALFYSTEVSDVFSITGEKTGIKRTAYTYFEFLFHLNPYLYSSLFSVDFNREYDKYLRTNNLSYASYSRTQFMEDVERGDIFIDYSNFKDMTLDYGEADSKEKIYFYVNHIIGRLQTILKDIQYLFLMNDDENPLSELLLKLVRFFKSYTVDVINMDTLIIADTKPENAMKYFDEIFYMKKLIQVPEKMHTSFDDVVNLLIGRFLASDDKNENVIKFKDKFISEVLIRLTSNKLNSIRLKEKFDLRNKEDEVNDKTKLYDNTKNVSITMTSKDNIPMKLTDKIVRKWFE